MDDHHKAAGHPSRMPSLYEPNAKARHFAALVTAWVDL